MQQTTNIIKNMEDYPLMLTADHISEILHMSKRRAYEVMELKSFPIICKGKLFSQSEAAPKETAQVKWCETCKRTANSQYNFCTICGSKLQVLYQ